MRLWAAAAGRTYGRLLNGRSLGRHQEASSAHVRHSGRARCRLRRRSHDLRQIPGERGARVGCATRVAGSRAWRVGLLRLPLSRWRVAVGRHHRWRSAALRLSAPPSRRRAGQAVKLYGRHGRSCHLYHVHGVHLPTRCVRESTRRATESTPNSTSRSIIVSRRGQDWLARGGISDRTWNTFFEAAGRYASQDSRWPDRTVRSHLAHDGTGCFQFGLKVCLAAFQADQLTQDERRRRSILPERCQRWFR
jgi:hypothetical protein